MKFVTQKIICALIRLRAPASTYIKSYYDKVQTGLSVGSWGDFAQELKNIYGQQDDKERAKKELTALWVNKDLARKNFVKYTEQYRMLARIVNYSDKVHIDKMKEIIPDKLRNALVIYEITNQSPKTWDDYLKLLMQAHKALHPDKTQGTIFGPEAIGEKSGGKKNPDAIEIDEIQRKEGKNLRYCQICAGKGFKNKSKMHNTVEAGANELHLELNVSGSLSLDDIRDEDPDNHILSWADTTDPGSHQQTMMIAAILNNQDQYRDSDCEDTKTWKAHVPE